MQKDFPKAKILLLGIFPRSTANDPVRATIAEINSIIARLHDGDRVHYLDIGEKFLDAGGNIPQDIMSDALHPTTKGYEIWAEAVKEPIASLLKDSLPFRKLKSRPSITRTGRCSSFNARRPEGALECGSKLPHSRELIRPDHG